MGRRTTKVISGNSTGFLYDLANPVQELSGTMPTANLLTAGLDEYFTRTDVNGTANFLTESLGSTSALTDSTGTIQTQYIFDPYGNTAQSGTSSTNSFAYTGRENDGAGLYFNRARYYSPALQRFISEDPLEFFGGMNYYSYALNNPENYVDPSGLVAGADDAVLAIGGALIGLGVQGASDLVTGKLSDWQHYAGAAAGGAIGGLAIEYTGGIATGALSGTTTNAVTQALEMLSGKQRPCFNYLSNVIDTGIGAIGGALPDLSIPGLTSGANSFNALANTIRTRLASGSWVNISGTSAAKALIGANVAGAGGLVAGVGASALGGGDAASGTLAGHSCGCN